MVTADPAAKAIPHGERRLALAAALATVVLWASAFVGIRAAGRVLTPGSLALARLLVGNVALGVLVIARRQALPRRVVLGCLIGFGGAVIIGFATSTRGFQAGLGAVLCVAAAVVYAGGVTAEKPLLARNSALTVTWLACSIGAVVCLPFAPQLIHELGRADPGTLAWAVYLGLVPTAVGFSFWAYALARTSGGRMGAMGYLVPPVAILLGWLILGAVPPLLALLGGVLCLGGVAVTRGAGLTGRLGVRRRVHV